jgi:leucyl/phenylalanyl-tRNA---protein transferase
MPVYRIPKEYYFPPASDADPNGLLGWGGDLHPHRLLKAYQRGIFPWYSEGQPILWFSPNPRYVLYPEKIHIPRSLKKIIRRGEYTITIDQAFDDVIKNCSLVARPRQFGTWITSEMKDAYTELHKMGVAHSVEAWKDGQLVGGLYGVINGALFAGESMFANASDSSKVAFVWIVRQLQKWGVKLIDCQVYTEHLERFGAEDMDREQYLQYVENLAFEPLSIDKWDFDEQFHPLG